jgi:hypothetical protein
MGGGMVAIFNVTATRRRTNAETEKLHAEAHKFHAEAEKIRIEIQTAAQQSQAAIDALDTKVAESVESVSGLAAKVEQQLDLGISEEGLRLLRLVARQAALSGDKAIPRSTLSVEYGEIDSSQMHADRLDLLLSKLILVGYVKQLAGGRLTVTSAGRQAIARGN